MSKSTPPIVKDVEQVSWQPAGRYNGAANGRHSPLADLVGSHLQTNGLRQIDFCRHAGFDQGLLSKILSSVVTTLNVETAIKLAEGMNLPPTIVFEAIGKKEVDDLLRRIYSTTNKQ